MGAYWGSRFVSVLSKDLSKARVVEVDLKPDGLRNGSGEPTSDQLYLPITEDSELYGHPHFDDKSRAQTEVRKHILLKSSDDLCELVVALEMTKHEMEYILAFESDIEGSAQRIESKREDIAMYENKIKALRKLRRAKVRID